MLFAATSLTDPSGSEQREVFQRVLGATRIDYDSSWGSSYTDGAAAPTEVDISYYAASYSRWRLRNTIAYDNKLFNRVEKALLNETPYKNTDLGNNNRVYTLKDKLYLPAIKASEEDTIYIGSNDQIRLKSIRVQSTQADYCNAAWSRTAFDHQNVSAYSVSINSSIYTGKSWSTTTIRTNLGQTKWSGEIRRLCCRRQIWIWIKSSLPPWFRFRKNSAAAAARVKFGPVPLMKQT